MAYYNIKRGVWVPDPVTVTRETTKLIDCPNLLDNVWRLIYLSVNVWMSKYKVYARSREEMDDAIADCEIKAYQYLLNKVRTKEYRRDLSLYLNTRAACQSAVGMYIHRLNTNKDKARRETISLGHDDGGWLESLAAESVPRMMTKSDAIKATKLRQRIAHPEIDRTPPSKAIEARRRDSAYQEYLEDCYELGVTPIGQIEFERANYADVLDEKPNIAPRIPTYGKRLQIERTPEQREQMRDYWREYKRKKKDQARRAWP